MKQLHMAYPLLMLALVNGAKQYVFMKVAITFSKDLTDASHFVSRDLLRFFHRTEATHLARAWCWPSGTRSGRIPDMH